MVREAGSISGCCANYPERESHFYQSVLHSQMDSFSVDPTACPLPHVLSFLQLVDWLVDRNLAFSTVKTYAAAISSCHEGFGDRSVFSHPLMKRFLRGVWRHRPVSRSLAPQWDLALVLLALVKAPFEPLDQVPLKF